MENGLRIPKKKKNTFRVRHNGGCSLSIGMDTADINFVICNFTS